MGVLAGWRKPWTGSVVAQLCDHGWPRPPRLSCLIFSERVGASISCCWEKGVHPRSIEHEARHPVGAQ